MKSILLDLRGQALNVLITEGAAVLYRTSLDRFDPADPKAAGDILAKVERDAGVPLDTVHLILPAETVSVSLYRTPPMSPADAGKVIRRKLVKDTRAESPVYRVLPLAAGGDKQTFLVETADRGGLSALVASFRDRGCTVRTVVTALQANLRAVAQSPADPGQRRAHIDLGRSHIELTVLAESQVLFHDRVAVPAADAERGTGNGAADDRTEKMRVYRTVEAVYRAYSNYQSAYPDLPVSSVGISGAGHALGGIVDVLRESTGVPVTKLNLLDGEPEDGPAYTALYGLALGLQDGSAAGLLPKDLAGRRIVLGRPVRIAALAACALVLIASAAIVESRHRRALTLYDTRRQELTARELALREAAAYLRHRELLAKLAGSEPAFYPLLGYVADHTPDGVLLAGISFARRAGGPHVELDFILPPVPDAGAQKLLSKLIAMIDRSGMLRRQDEPSLTIVKEARAARLHFKVVCEVLTHEKTR